MGVHPPLIGHPANFLVRPKPYPYVPMGVPTVGSYGVQGYLGHKKQYQEVGGVGPTVGDSVGTYDGGGGCTRKLAGSARHMSALFMEVFQGYLAHKKQPPPLGPPYDPRYSPKGFRGTRKLAGLARQTTAHARCTHASRSGRYRTSREIETTDYEPFALHAPIHWAI